MHKELVKWILKILNNEKQSSGRITWLWLILLLFLRLTDKSGLKNNVPGLSRSLCEQLSKDLGSWSYPQEWEKQGSNL